MHCECDVMSCVTCTSNKVEYLEKEESYKNSIKEVIVILNNLLNAMNKYLDKISYHKDFNRVV